MTLKSIVGYVVAMYAVTAFVAWDFVPDFGALDAGDRLWTILTYCVAAVIWFNTKVETK